MLTRFPCVMLVLAPLGAAHSQAQPAVDHHQHLFSPAASILVSPKPLPPVQLPADLDSLIEARSRFARDSSALRELYTDDAWLVRSSDPAWIRGRDAVVASWIGSTPAAVRLIPVGWDIHGSAGHVTAYFTEGQADSARHAAHVLLSVRKDPGTRWRIAAEAVTPPPTRIGPISGRDLVGLLDAAGIRRAVVLSLGYTWGSVNRTVENEYEKVKTENDWTAQQVAQFPDRLRVFCSFNPLKDYALEELARCAKDPRLRFGLKLHLANSGVDYHNPQHVAQVRRVFAAANTYRMPIIVHIRASISRRLAYGRDEARTFLEEILPAAADVPVQIGHLAGAGGYDDPTTDQAVSVFTEAIKRKDPRTRRLYFDVAGSVVDLSLEKAALVARRLRELGIDRILYGSDAAAGGNLPPRQSWAAFRQLPLSEAEFRTIANNVAPYLRQ